MVFIRSAPACLCLFFFSFFSFFSPEVSSSPEISSRKIVTGAQWCLLGRNIMSSHVQTMNVNCTWGWSLECLSEFLVLFAPHQRAKRWRMAARYLPFSRWRGRLNNVHGRGNMSWGPTMVNPYPTPLPPWPLTILTAICQYASLTWSVRCSPGVLVPSVWSCVTQSCLVSEGSVGGIWYPELIFMCITSLLYTECCTIHAASCLKKILKVRKIFLNFWFQKACHIYFLNVLMKI